MPQKRSDFYKSLNQMRDSNQSLGNPLINTVDDTTSVGSELSSFAYTTNNGVDFISDSQIARSREERGYEEYKQSRNPWQRFWDTTQDIGNNFGEGFLNFIDGIIDAGAYVVGLFGDESFKAGVQDVMNYDWQQYVLNTGQQLNFGNAILSGDLFGGEYWQNWADTFDFENNSSRDNLNKTKASSYQSDMGGFGDFMVSAEEGVGYVLPSIIAGVFTGGASAGVQAAAAGISLAATGVSAFGSGTNQALKEGASYEKAGQSGLVSAGIEMGTEALSWGTGKIAGKIAGKATTYGTRVGAASFGQQIGKLTAKEVGKAALEEGTEEFISELLSPLARQVYDENAIKDAWLTVGSKENREMWRNAVISAGAGAVGGAFGAGVQGVYVKSKLTDTGIDLANDYREIASLHEEAIKEAGKGQKADQKLITEYETQIGKLTQEFEQKMEAFKEKDPEHFKNLMEMIKNPKEYIKQLKKENSELTKEEIGKYRNSYIDDYKELTQSLNQSTYDKIAELNSDKNGKIVIGKDSNFDIGNFTSEFIEENGIKEGDELKAYYDPDTKTTLINPKYKAEFYELSAHEKISHGILDTNESVRDALIADIESDDKLSQEYHKNDKELELKYGDQGEEVMTSERLAAFLENYIKNQKAYNRVLNIKSKNKLANLLNKIKRSVALTQDSRFLKQIDKAINSINNAKDTANVLKPRMAFSKTNVDREIASNIISRYNNFLSNNKNIVGGVFVSGNYLVLADSNNFDIKINKKVDLGDFDRLESNYIKSLFEKGVSYNEKEFARLLRQGIGEIRKYQQGDERNDVQSFEHRRQGKTNSIEQDDGRRVNKGSRRLKLSKDSNTGYYYLNEGSVNQDVIRVEKIDNGYRIRIPSRDVSKIVSNATELKHELSVLRATKNGVEAKVVADTNTNVNEDTVFTDKELNKLGYFRDDSIEMSKLKANLYQDKVYDFSNNYNIIHEIRDQIKSLAEEVGLSEVKVDVSMGKLAKVNVLDLNKGKDVNEVVDGIVDTFKEMTITDSDGDRMFIKDAIFKGDEAEYNKWVDSIRDGLIQALNENGKDSKVNALKKVFRNRIMKLLEQRNNWREVSRINKLYNKTKSNLMDKISGTREWTDNNMTYHPISLLAEPFTQFLESTTYTRSQLSYDFNNTKFAQEHDLKIDDFKDLSDKKIAEKLSSLGASKNQIARLTNIIKNDGKSFVSQIENILLKYSETAWKSQSVPFDSEIRGQLERVLELAKNSDTKQVNSELFRESLKALQMIDSLFGKAQKNYQEINKPKAIASSELYKNYFDEHKITRMLAKLSKAATTSSSEVLAMLGDNPLTNILVYDFSKAQAAKELYVGDYKTKLYDYIKSNKLNGKLKKKVKINSVGGKSIDLQIDEVLGLYLEITKNIDTANDSGVKYSKKGKDTVLADKNSKSVNALLKQLEGYLDEDVLDYGNFLADMLNGELQNDYKDWYVKTYNVEPNEVSDYWMIHRVNQQMASAESLVKAPSLFGNAISRVKSTEYLGVFSATNAFLDYVDSLGTELDFGDTNGLKTTYRNAIAIFNTKINDTDTLDGYLRKVGGFDEGYIKRHIDSQLGIYEGKSKGKFARLMSNYSVAKLSFNIGSIPKQFASLFTSNIPLLKGFQGTWNRMFANKAFKTELQWFIDNIGSLKYRGAEAIAGNTNGVVSKAGEIGMSGIRFIDRVTVQCGLSSIMTIGQSMGLELGSEQFRNYVISQWYVFENSQVGSKANNLNAISRGDYGNIASAIFGIMQGANRAALGSQLTKIATFAQYRKVDIKSIESQHDSAESLVKTLQTEIDDIDTKIAGELDPEEIKVLETKKEEIVNKQIKARADVEKTESIIKGYKNFKTMGGNKLGGLAIPVNIVSGLAAQAIFITLISKLVRKILKKEEWDEWDFSMNGIGKDLLLNFSLNWIPVVNAISNKIFNNYDLTNPSVTLISDSVDMLTNLYTSITTGEDWNKVLQSSLSFGELFGIPANTFKNYVFAIIKYSDPETGLKVDNFWYGVSLTGMSRKYSEYIASGKTDLASAELKSIFAEKGLSGVSDSTIEEIVRLASEGYTVSPSKTMESYTDESGNEVNLTDEQIKAFSVLYNEASAKATKIIKLTDYKSQSDENKAKILSSLYSAYYQYAKAITIKAVPQSKLAKLLYYTNGSVEFSTYLIYINKINSIEKTEKNSRKELALKYINSQKISKQEKLLLMYLAGYKVSNTNVLKNYLLKCGMDRKSASEFLGE